MKKISVTLSRRSDPFHGIDTYSEKLERYIGVQAKINLHTYRSVHYNNIFSNCNMLKKSYNICSRIYRDQVDLPFFLKKNKTEIFHCTENYGIPMVLPCKSVVTVHDTIPLLEKTTKFEKCRFAKQTGYAIKRSDKIVTVSQYSKLDIIKFFNVSPNKIEVVYVGQDEIFKQCNNVKKINQIKKKYKIWLPFIMMVGGSNPRKNAKRIIEIFKSKYQNKYQLVIVGGKHRDIGFESGHNNDHVVFTDFINQEELALLYNAARLFVFPSLYEGFGMPILEAMACGTPVVCSNISSMPEVANGAALLVDPYDNYSIASSMDKILNDHALSQELIFKGLERTAFFDLNKSALELIEVYEEMLK